MSFSNNEIFNVFGVGETILNTGVVGNDIFGSFLFVLKSLCLIISFYCIYSTAKNLSDEHYYRALFAFCASLISGLAMNISQIIVS